MTQTKWFLKSNIRFHSRKCIYVLICLTKPKRILAALAFVTYLCIVYAALQQAYYYTEDLNSTRLGQRSVNFPNDFPYSRNVSASNLSKNAHKPTENTKLLLLNESSLTATVGYKCTRESSLLNINCSNIHEIELGKQLGYGSYKIAFEGKIRGLRVAVKFVNKDMLNNCYNRTMLELKNTKHPNYVSRGHNVTQENYINHLSKSAKTSCLDPHVKGFANEIHFAKTLNHSLIAPMLGYCFRNDTYFPGSYDVNKNDIVSVWEYANEVTLKEFTTWQQRIEQCIKLIDFLLYLEKFSVKFVDLKQKNFLFVCGEYKFIDFESMSVSQPKYKIHSAKRNMRNMREYILKLLLNITFPPDVLERIKLLMDDVKLQHEEYGLTAHQWLSILSPIKLLISKT